MGTFEHITGQSDLAVLVGVAGADGIPGRFPGPVDRIQHRALAIGMTSRTLTSWERSNRATPSDCLHLGSLACKRARLHLKENRRSDCAP